MDLALIFFQASHIHLFNKYLLSTYYVLSTGDTAVNKTDNKQGNQFMLSNSS